MDDPLLDRLVASERRLAQKDEDVDDHVRNQQQTAVAIAYYEQILDDAVAAHDPGHIIERLLDRLCLILDVECAELLLVEGDRLVPRAASGSEREVHDTEPLAQRVVNSGSAQACPEDDLDETLRAHGMRRAAAAPVGNSGRLEGVLQVADSRPHAFLGEELALLSLVGTQLGHCLERARLVKELEEQMAHAKEVSQFKTTLLHVMAHDVKTPLTALQTQCQLLEKDILPAPQRQATARRAVTNVQRLRLMLDDFLDMARIDAGRFELHLRPVDLAAAAQEVAELFEAQAQAKGVKLVLDVQRTPTWADADRIRQVLNNLVSNAVRYTDSGGTVVIRCRPTGGARLEVTDTGQGMTAGQIADAFQAFRQMHETGTEARGAGLGLHLARTIVQEHGGRLDITSPGPGKGTTVRLQLPAIRAR